MKKIDPFLAADKLDGYWQPKILAELNGQHLRIAKLDGEFTWHCHEKEDEMFMVLKGELCIHFRDREVVLKKNDLIVVPKGIEHKPVAKKDTLILLFEPAGTINTGDSEESDFTLKNLDWI